MGDKSSITFTEDSGSQDAELEDREITRYAQQSTKSEGSSTGSGGSSVLVEEVVVEMPPFVGMDDVEDLFRRGRRLDSVGLTVRIPGGIVSEIELTGVTIQGFSLEVDGDQAKVTLILRFEDKTQQTELQPESESSSSDSSGVEFIDGIGARGAAYLVAAGIGDLEALAVADPATKVEGVGSERLQSWIAQAQAWVAFPALRSPDHLAVLAALGISSDAALAKRAGSIDQDSIAAAVLGADVREGYDASLIATLVAETVKRGDGEPV